MHVINFTYTILEEDLSWQGNHPLAIFKSEESYTYLKSALEDIINEVGELQTITLNGTVWKINYYLGGDWKFLAIVTGRPEMGCFIKLVLIAWTHYFNRC